MHNSARPDMFDEGDRHGEPATFAGHRRQFHVLGPHAEIEFGVARRRALFEQGFVMKLDATAFGEV